MSDDVSVSGGNPAPTSFAEAMAADATPASDPATTTPDSAQPAEQAESSTTVPSQHGSDDDRSPFIPRARFDEVNTKLKELKEWRESRSWAEQVDPQAFQTMVQWFGKATADPRAFAIQLIEELSNHPDHAPAMRSELARRLGTRPQKASTDDNLDPDVAITDAQGNVVGRTYSDQLLAKREARLREQIQQEVDAKYASHFKTLDEFKSQREREQQAAQANEFGASFYKELSALPLADKHRGEIGEALRAMRLESDHPDAVRAAAYRAYHQVVGPKLLASGQQTVVADLQRKAHASTAVNPSAAALSTPARPRSFDDPSLQW
jgi:hypothetical protein